MYSYQQTSEYTKERLAKKDLVGSSVISISVADTQRILARSPFELLSKLSNTYPEILRQSLFVRIVSQFEVFLVDTVLEISNRSIDPFKQQDKMLQYHQAELLSYKSIDDIFFDIVTDECRQLTSQGFSYSRKYYEKRFGIHLENSGVLIDDIEEIHERRHLFVHRGGIIDSKYQKRFAPYLDVDDQLEISEQYILTALDKLTVVAEYIINCVKTNWPMPLLDFSEILEEEGQTETKNRLTYRFIAQFSDQQSMKTHISPTMSFPANNEKHQLSEILISTTIRSDTEVEWIVDGLKLIVGPYVAIQKMLSKRGNFTSFDSKRISSAAIKGNINPGTNLKVTNA